MGSFKEMLAKDILERTGMNARPMMDLGIISLDEARKWVVKKKYYEMAKTGMPLTEIKYELAETYGMSVSAIDKMIYKPRKPKQLTHE
ncbi:MAG: hypothetical protein FD155_3385 [Bacteroidetes bacterium]|nr:MAG: hypothetical protein FD155_3385 [Bacteroidota bacterium]